MADAPALAEWIGRSVETVDIASASPVRRLAAMLDEDAGAVAGDVLPLLGHWLFHLPETPQAELGPDGHAAKGSFLPPIAQPRRMWAGGSFRFLTPVRIGAEMVKHTTIVDVVEKRGTSGEMVFVTLRHVIVADGEDAIVEDQDLVYLPPSPPTVSKPGVQPPPDSERGMVADEALLLRFSALTFNAHRIHYDGDYAREQEGYPALVVHGPLQAMLLLRHAQADGIEPAGFAFRARAPLYAGRPFTLARAGNDLWVRDDRGGITMTATVTA